MFKTCCLGGRSLMLSRKCCHSDNMITFRVVIESPVQWGGGLVKGNLENILLLAYCEKILACP